MVALAIVVVFLGICVWLTVRVLRVPKKPEHEREQERLRDPAITAYRSGGDLGGGGL